MFCDEFSKVFVLGASWLCSGGERRALAHDAALPGSNAAAAAASGTRLRSGDWSKAMDATWTFEPMPMT